MCLADLSLNAHFMLLFGLCRPIEYGLQLPGALEIAVNSTVGSSGEIDLLEA